MQRTESFFNVGGKRFKIIYADPPWSYNAASKNGTSRGVAEKHYATIRQTNHPQTM